MSRTLSLTTALKTAAAGTAALGALALAGCGAGQITQTSTQVSAVDGAAGTVGQIGVRNASIVFGSDKTAAIYPAGGSAPLQMSIVNFGGVDDRLVSVSSTVAGSVRIGGDPRISAGRALTIAGKAEGEAGEAGATASATPSGPPASPAASAAPSASAAPTAAPSAAPTASGEAEATPTPSADGTTSATIDLVGLKQDIRAGLTYPVTFTFAKAGALTLQVPVANPAEPRAEGGE